MLSGLSFARCFIAVGKLFQWLTCHRLLAFLLGSCVLLVRWKGLAFLVNKLATFVWAELVYHLRELLTLQLVRHHSFQLHGMLCKYLTPSIPAESQLHSCPTATVPDLGGTDVLGRSALCLFLFRRQGKLFLSLPSPEVATYGPPTNCGFPFGPFAPSWKRDPQNTTLQGLSSSSPNQGPASWVCLFLGWTPPPQTPPKKKVVFVLLILF